MLRTVRRSVPGCAALALTASSTAISSVASRPSGSTAWAVTGAVSDCSGTDAPLTIRYSAPTTGQRTAVAVGSAPRTAASTLGWHGRSRGSSAYARGAHSETTAEISATVTAA